VDRAVNLGWPRPQVTVIDDDLGVSGGGGARVGFERLVAEVGLGHIGIVLAIEVSRLAHHQLVAPTQEGLANVLQKDSPGRLLSSPPTLWSGAMLRIVSANSNSVSGAGTRARRRREKRIFGGLAFIVAARCVGG